MEKHRLAEKAQDLPALVWYSVEPEYLATLVIVGLLWLNQFLCDGVFHTGW